ANVNDAPTGSVTISGTPTQGQTLTAANTLADVDGLGTISYQWFADGAAISGATGSTLLLGQAQVGQAFTVTASYIDGFGTTESVASAATAVVANVNDAPTGGVTISGTPAQGQTLTAANTLADVDGPGTISYQWFANGALIRGATGDSLLLSQAQVGQAISVTASYIDGFGTAESVASAATAAVANVNNAATGSVTVSGTPTQGQTLTAANTLADVDGLGTISYQWNANGVAISGATGSTLLLSQAQVGQTITVTARYTDGFGTAESVTSEATDEVANVNDAPTGSVAISGTPAQGRTLTVANTLADVDGLGPISYQWFADGAPLSGATGDSLLLSQAQVGQSISVTASYIDGFDNPESVTSAMSAAVANINDAPVLAQDLVDQTTTQGETLQFALPSNTFTDADPGDTLKLVATLANGKALPQWMRFDAASQTFVVSPPLGGADGPVAVRVVATDASGASAQVVFAVVVLPAPVWPVVPDPAPTPAPAPAEAAAPVLEPEPAPAPEQAPEQAPEPEPEPAAPQAPETLTPTDEFVVGGSEASRVSRAALAAAGAAIRIPLPTAVQVAEVLKVRPSSRSEGVPGVEAALGYSNLASAQWSQLLRGDDVLRQLDELQRQMTESTDGQRAVMASSVAVTAGLSAGYVVWLVRGGVLVSSMLSALPAWQLIDPMPVMAAAKGAARRRDPEPSDEPEVERLFGDDPQATPHESADTTTRLAATAAAPDTTADAARRATPPSTQARP
ncbi:MAG: putative Ig domain-containing protein, partial [Burkholderiales bacterium]